MDVTFNCHNLNSMSSHESFSANRLGSGDTADSAPPLYDSNSSQESEPDGQEPAANTTIKKYV